MGAGIVFDLIGNDKSASAALEGVKDSGKKAAGAIGGAFAALAIGDVITKSFDNEKVLAKFSAGLGQTPAIAKKAGDLAGKIYADGWGTSLEDVTGAIGNVGEQLYNLADMSPDEISKITQSALDLAEVMGEDVVGVTRAAGQMMKNGLAPNAMQAFDIIATGIGNGANASADLLDTLTEYSPHFGKLGIDGTAALSMIKSGLDNGIFTADLAADAFKEFGIRALDVIPSATGAATASADAFGALGFNAQEMATKIAMGGPAAQQATGEVLTAIASMQDPLAQNDVAVSLFGTQWEDAGIKALLAMNPVQQKTIDIEGASKSMGDTLHATAQNKVDKMTRSFENWTTEMVETDGVMGDVATTAVAFGPQAVAFAGSVGMIIVGMKALGISAAGAIALAASPLAAIVATIAAISAFVYVQLPGIKTQLENFNKAETVGDKARSLAALPFNFNGTQVMPTGQRGVAAYNAPSAVQLRNQGASYLRPFATGGVVMPTRNGTDAKIGEAGEPEAVVPLSKWGELTGGSGGGGGETHNHFHFSGLMAGTPAELAQKMHDIVTLGARQGVYSEFGK